MNITSFFTVPEIPEALLVLASVDCSSQSNVDFLDLGMMSDFLCPGQFGYYVRRLFPFKCHLAGSHPVQV